MTLCQKCLLSQLSLHTKNCSSGSIDQPWWLLISTNYRYKCIFEVKGLQGHVTFCQKLPFHIYLHVPKIRPLALLASLELDVYIINEVYDVASLSPMLYQI